ncbi:MAG: peptidoglycan DD-metalloendopeptidase family protein [Burkholderiaceae bacterium]|jgi:lipoprotein NlpD
MFGVFARPVWGVTVALGLVALLSGCASNGNLAPVTDRSPNPAARSEPQPAPPVLPETPPPSPPVPTYTVKPGDTIFSIGQRTNQDYRQLAAWNNLDASFHLQVGQTLRLGPPDLASGDTVAQATPVGSSTVEQRALGASAASDAGMPGSPSPPPPGNAGANAPLKSGPSGVKRPYSDAALAELSRPEGQADSGTPPAPPAVVAMANPSPAPAPDAAAPAGDEAAIGWIWPAKGPLLSQFNAPKNKGIDIAGKMGDPILASGSGTVIYVGQGLRGLGNLVVVKHTEGLISVYAHNSKILVANNQPVKRGDQIAEMGNSESEKIELHFEIRRQGEPVDPLKYLPSR